MPTKPPKRDDHSRLFDLIRQRADASSVGQAQPQLTAKEFGNQVMRGLGQAGINTAAFLPEIFARGTLPAPLVDILRPQLNAFVDKQFTQPELQSLDEYWGRPESGGGRGTAALSQLLGMVALGAAIPGGGKHPVASTAEHQRIVAALKNAPAGSGEARFLNDLLSASPKERQHLIPGDWYESPEEQARLSAPDNLEWYRDQGHSLGTEGGAEGWERAQNLVEDLLNLRTFGSKRGPFSTSGRHNYQDLVEGKSDIVEIPPIASADEVYGFTDQPIRPTRRRFSITEQMRDPDWQSGKAAQYELHQRRIYEELSNQLTRDDIMREVQYPSHIAKGSLPVDIKDPSLLLAQLRRLQGNLKQ